MGSGLLNLEEEAEVVAFDPQRLDADAKLIFASNGGGDNFCYRQKAPNQYESAGDIQTQKSGKTLAFDPKTKRIFPSAAEVGTVPAAGQRAGGRSRGRSMY